MYISLTLKIPNTTHNFVFLPHEILKLQNISTKFVDMAVAIHHNAIRSIVNIHFAPLPDFHSNPK